MAAKVCKECELEQDEEVFYPTRSGGRLNTCRSCCAKAFRKNQLMRWYGLTVEDLEDLLEFQYNTCAICEADFLEVRSEVDHGHDDLVTRGVLCVRCNTALGAFGDDIEMLKRAVAYLEYPPSEQIWNTPRKGRSLRPTNNNWGTR